MKLVRVDIGMATAGNTEDEERNNSGSIEDKELKETRQSFRRDPTMWVHRQIENGVEARQVLQRLIPEVTIPEQVNELSLWRLVLEILSEPAPREQLKHVNSIEDAKRLIQECKNIIVLTGAGVSVSCGIPDFRSRDGIYARLSKDYPDLPDPQAMFDIHYFHHNPWPFFKFAKEIYPGQFTPSLCHRFIAHLDKQGKLLRNYTQNIDTLEQVAGIKNIVQCHGSFATASCLNCKAKVTADAVKEDIFQQKIPYCRQCTVEENSGRTNILKPDIVFFGESLPDHFHKQIEIDKDKADLLIVIGSSLKVRPVSLLPNLVNPNIPQILINREPLHHHKFDIEFFGNCDDVISELCNQLGGEWTSVTQSFKQSPIEKHILQKMFADAKAMFESGGDSSNDSNDIPENLQVLPNEVNGLPNGFSNNKKPNSLVGNNPDDSIQDDLKDISDRATSSDLKYANSGNDEVQVNSPSSDKSLKRRKETLEERELTKRIRNQSISEKEESKESIFYLPIPPNRYIFHGAELEYFDSDADSDDEQGDFELVNGVETAPEYENIANKANHQIVQNSGNSAARVHQNEKITNVDSLQTTDREAHNITPAINKESYGQHGSLYESIDTKQTEPTGTIEQFDALGKP